MKESEVIDSFPRVHPRTDVVHGAAIEHAEFFGRLMGKSCLTRTESLMILAGCQDVILRASLRCERHPRDPTKAADVE